MRVYQFRHVGTDAAYCFLLLEYLLQNNLLQQFCYYSDLKSFAPDELSLHTAHQPCTAFLQLHSREGLSLQETEIIEQYLPKSNALRSFSPFFIGGVLVLFPLRYPLGKPRRRPVHYRTSPRQY
nr:hypothetical protein [uncultured Janthinobacterium sp.]